MGIIRAAAQAIGGSLADQWLEVYEPDDMGDKNRLYKRRSDPEGTEQKRNGEYRFQWFHHPCIR